MRRMERWALQAVREDARRVRRDIAESALRRPRTAAPRRRSCASSPAHDEECRRLDAFMRTLSREGITDIAGIALGGAAAAVAGGWANVSGASVAEPFSPPPERSR